MNLLRYFIMVAAVLFTTACGPAELEDGELGQEAQALEVNPGTNDFKPCVCLDKSQVISCGTGSTCTKYRKQGTYSFWCAPKNATVICPDYVPYTCRKRSYLKGSLPCCSGKYRIRSDDQVVCL